MNDADKIHALGLFAASDGRSIKNLAILDGFVYATDWRIAIKMKLNDLHQNEVPSSYPIIKLKSILLEADECNATGVITDEDFKPIDDGFMQYARGERNQHNRDYLERYKAMVCPCCGDTVYLDNEKDKLVEKMEPQDKFDIRDVSKSIALDFGDEKVYVGMSYLHMIIDAFNKDYNLRFAPCKVSGNNRKLLCFKSTDGDLTGVLMPMYYPTDYIPLTDYNIIVYPF